VLLGGSHEGHAHAPWLSRCDMRQRATCATKALRNVLKALTELFSVAGTLGAHTLDSAALIVPSLEGIMCIKQRTTRGGAVRTWRLASREAEKRLYSRQFGSHLGTDR
jgi:hypothetical protein